jgi:hypothetical protein
MKSSIRTAKTMLAALLLLLVCAAGGCGCDYVVRDTYHVAVLDSMTGLPVESPTFAAGGSTATCDEPGVSLSVVTKFDGGPIAFVDARAGVAIRAHGGMSSAEPPDGARCGPRAERPRFQRLLEGGPRRPLRPAVRSHEEGYQGISSSWRSAGSGGAGSGSVW